jgi:hypothetical protein
MELMEITIKTSNKQQEKYILAILNSLGIAYSETKKNDKLPVKEKAHDLKKQTPLDVMLAMKGILKDFDPKGDARAERIINKHK